MTVRMTARKYEHSYRIGAPRHSIARPAAHSAVASSHTVYVLRTIRLAIGSDRGDLPWTAEDSKMQSLAGGPPRGQNGEADRDRYSLKWTVPLHTGSVLDPNERLEH